MWCLIRVPGKSLEDMVFGGKDSKGCCVKVVCKHLHMETPRLAHPPLLSLEKSRRGVGPPGREAAAIPMPVLPCLEEALLRWIEEDSDAAEAVRSILEDTWSNARFNDFLHVERQNSPARISFADEG